MLHGDMPSMGELIDPIGCQEEEFRNPILEKKGQGETRDWNFSTADYFSQIKISKMKTNYNDRNGKSALYENALYGSFWGDTNSMLKVAYTWDDTLWSYIKTVFFFKITEKYIEAEEEYLETYNMTHGDFHGIEEKFKSEFSNWEFPHSWPTDFDGILENSVDKMHDSAIWFANREQNPFFEIISLILQIQLKASKVTVNSKNRWNLIVDKIYDLNQIRKYTPEDLIFLRFSAHFLIILYTLLRIDESRVEKYNEVLLKFINSEEEIDSPMHTFYLNFVIGDDKKVEYYSDQIYTISDKVTQDKILENIDVFLPKLKEDIKGNSNY